MALVRWDRLRDMTALQDEVNRIFSRAGEGDVADRQTCMPSVGAVEAQDAIKLEVEPAGMTPEDINSEDINSIGCGRRSAAAESASQESR